MSRPTYRVDAARHGGWWLLTSPDVPGAVSQVRRLAAAEEHVREAIAFVLDVGQASFDLNVIPNLGSGLTDEVAKARAAVDSAAKAQREAAEQSRKVVAELIGNHRLSGTEVAALLGLSPQRVSQLAKGTHARQRPPAKVAARAAPNVTAKSGSRKTAKSSRSK